EHDADQYPEKYADGDDGANDREIDDLKHVFGRCLSGCAWRGASSTERSRISSAALPCECLAPEAVGRFPAFLTRSVRCAAYASGAPVARARDAQACFRRSAQQLPVLAEVKSQGRCCSDP